MTNPTWNVVVGRMAYCPPLFPERESSLRIPISDIGREGLIEERFAMATLLGLKWRYGAMAFSTF